MKEPEGSEIDAIVEIDELNAYDLPSPLQRQRRGVVSTILHHKADPNAPVQSEVRGLPVLNIDSVGSFSRNQELSGNVFAIGDNEVSADEWARLLVQTQRRDIINMMLNYRADPSLLGATDSSPVDMAISDGMVFPPVGAESASQAESKDSKDTAAQSPWTTAAGMVKAAVHVKSAWRLQRDRVLVEQEEEPTHSLESMVAEADHELKPRQQAEPIAREAQLQPMARTQTQADGWDSPGDGFRCPHCQRLIEPKVANDSHVPMDSDNRAAAEDRQILVRTVIRNAVMLAATLTGLNESSDAARGGDGVCGLMKGQVSQVMDNDFAAWLQALEKRAGVR